MPKGIPSGGQFAPGAHGEADLNLDRSDRLQPADMGPDQIRDWVCAQASHHLSPVIGWIRRDAAKGNDTSQHLTTFRERVGRLADDVADRFSAMPQGLQERIGATNVASEAIWGNIQPVFQDVLTASGDDSRITAIRWRTAAAAAADEIGKKVTAPAPVLDGFTAGQVEEHMARTEHQRQCGCVLNGDVCSTPEYGENWRWRMGVPNVEGMFEALQEMAAARDAKATTEENA